MAVAAISGNFQKRFNGFNEKTRSNSVIMTNSISNIDSFQKAGAVSFTANPEPAEQAMIKLTEKAGTVFNGLLIKARQFAAKRLGLVNKADIANVEVDAADIKNAIDFFAKRTKEEFHVGYMSVLERAKANTAKKAAGKAESHLYEGGHIGYENILEREKNHAQGAKNVIKESTPQSHKANQAGFNSPIYKAATNN